jgi:flavin reductase (DIM6/NTAB) family NADH-FMN oxidoreductase RutF
MDVGPPAVDPGDFRKVLGCFVTGVTLVATLGPDRVPRGITANSFTSVSLAPPLILVCIARSASSHRVFSEVDRFAVSILGQDQQDLSARFASRLPDKFSNVRWGLTRGGSPVLSDSVAWLDCSKHEAFDAGDHTILVGRVLQFGHSERPALGYYRGRYVAVADQARWGDPRAGDTKAIGAAAAESKAALDRGHYAERSGAGRQSEWDCLSAR